MSGRGCDERIDQQLDVERAAKRGDRLGAVDDGIDEIGDDGFVRLVREGHRIRARAECRLLAFLEPRAVGKENDELARSVLRVPATGTAPKSATRREPT